MMKVHLLEISSEVKALHLNIIVVHAFNFSASKPHFPEHSVQRQWEDCGIEILPLEKNG